jgi:NAD(P)-dependent dehydrogenase (short-subunit alcohol dehydrogenase family)
MGQVEGKVAIVTDGTSGIGAACAVTLAQEGWTILRATQCWRKSTTPVTKRHFPITRR